MREWGEEMSARNVIAIGIMIWITLLTVWAVNRIADPLNNKVMSVSGIPSQPTPPQQVSTVQIDKDTVWIIDPNTNYIRVVTHDEDGYHVTGSMMTFTEVTSR